MRLDDFFKIGDGINVKTLEKNGTIKFLSMGKCKFYWTQNLKLFCETCQDCLEGASTRMFSTV